MKNIHSPYQQTLRGIIGNIYNHVDVIIINQKIDKLKSFTNDAVTPRQLDINNMLNTCYLNREFILRQLNQQMIERVL